jgi:hypothetical protein
MILLDTTLKSLEVVLAGAVATSQLPFVSSYADINQITFAMTALPSTDGTTNNTTPVTLVAAPAASTTRQVKAVTIYNGDTAPRTVTVRLNNNSTIRVLMTAILAVGDTLFYGPDGHWQVLYSTGAMPPTGTNNAVQLRDGTGRVLKDSVVTINAGAMTGVTTLNVSGALTNNLASVVSSGDLAVADGGTGRSTSTTAYGLLAAGTTATGAHQTLPAGATTDILVGAGTAALPVWTAATGTGSPVRATSPTLVTPTLGAASATSLALTSPLTVANGGTGRATSTTAYGLLAAGTTATGAHQTLAAGLTTEILVGGGTGALPAWTTATGTGAPVRATSPAITTAINPVSNGGASLGISGTAWSNLFLSVGAAINWNAGGATITHAVGTLAIGGSSPPNILLGGTASRNVGDLSSPGAGIASRVQVDATTVTTGYSGMRWSTTAAQSAQIVLGKSASGSIGTFTAVASTHVLGRIGFVGADGADANTVGASIRALVTGAVSASRIPTALIFSTAAGAGADDVAEKMRITSAGNVHPGTNDGGSLGISGTGFSDLFLASGGVINWAADNVTLTHATGILSTNAGTKVGIGIASPDGTLHVHTATAGIVAASGSADDFVIESDNAQTGFSVLAPDASTINQAFGYASDADAIAIRAVYNSGNPYIRIDNGLGTERFRFKLDAAPQLGINTNSPDGTLHVHTATAGTVAAVSTADDLVVENNGIGGISILTPDANAGNYNFGSPSENRYATISGQYNSGSPLVGLYNVASERFRFALGAQTLAAAATGIGFRVNLPDTTITGAASGYFTTYIDRVDITAATSQTIITGASLYIEGAPTGIGAGPAIITNAYAIWVDAGLSRFDGNGTTVFEVPNDTGAVGSHYGRIPIHITGVGTKYIDVFN